jgi:hypothetical protein
MIITGVSVGTLIQIPLITISQYFAPMLNVDSKSKPKSNCFVMLASTAVNQAAISKQSSDPGTHLLL